MSAPGIWDSEYAAENWQVLLVFWALMIGCALVNLMPNKVLDALNKACIYWTGATVIIVLVTLLSMARNGRNSGEFVFSEFDASPSGYPSGKLFFLSLLGYC